MPAAKLERNEELVRRRVAGDDFQSLSRRFGVSPQRVAVVFRDQATKAIDALEMSLLTDIKTGQTTLLLVPDHPAEDRDLALGWLAYCLRRLAERGVEVGVEPRIAEDGVIFALTDVTPYATGERP